MRKIWSILTLLVAIISVSACQSTDELDAVYNTLEVPNEVITYTLPSESGNITITWTSSNDNVISNNVLLQQSEETSFTLYAFLSDGNNKVMKTFDVTLLPLDNNTDPIDNPDDPNNETDTEAPTFDAIEDQIIPQSITNVNWTTVIENVVDNVDTSVELVEVSDMINYGVIGTYSVTVKAIDNSGNEKTQTFNVSVIDSTNPTFDLIEDQFIALSATDIDWTTFISNEDDNHSNQLTLTEVYDNVSYGVPGDYTVKVEVTDEAGNSSSQVFTVTIAGETVIYTGYYEGAEYLTGDTLKAFLHNLIDDHIRRSYDDMWEILAETDEDPNNSNNVILLYTGRSQDKDEHGGAVDEWNREHVWPRSLGGFETTLGPGTDAHALRPTDVTVNSSRGNKVFDEGGTTVYDTGRATECLADTDSFEPRDEVKGDVARMIFYMAVRYEGDDGFMDLEIVDYASDAAPYMGILSTLLEWHIEDPVDDFEMNRNNVVETYQGNRNPFIDHPEFVALIWS
jgi:endonuclease I